MIRKLMDDFYQNGIHYIRLISSCPVCFEESEIHTPKTYWMHEECHGDIANNLIHNANNGFKQYC